LTDSPDEARRYSLRLLSYRARSEKELRDRLEKKGFSARSISPVMQSLKDVKLLDDAALAEQLRRQAREIRLLGYGSAKAYMLKRGLPRDIVEGALEFDGNEELRSARKLADKKLKSMGNYLTPGDRRKLWNFLARRGYSFGTIRDVLKDVHFEETGE
jgi:regulatory protein